jgi:glucose-6-phosphate isomerase
MTQPIQPFIVKDNESILVKLNALEKQFEHVHLNDLFAQDDQRFQKFSVVFEQLVLDFSKHRVDQSVLDHLIQFAETQNLEQWIKKLFSEQNINYTEQRAAMHWALRLPENDPVHSQLSAQVHDQLQRMFSLVEKIHAGQCRGATGEVIQDVVNQIWAP